MANLEGRVENGNEDHQEILELLPWYLNGTLGAEERATVDLHLHECASCQFELEEMTGLQTAMLAEELDLSAIFLEDTMAEIKSRPKEKARIEPKRESEKPRKQKEKRFTLRPRLAFTFSAIMLFFVVGLLLGGFFFTGITDKYLTNSQTTGAEGTGAQNIGPAGQLQQGFEYQDGVIFLAKRISTQGTFTTKVGELERARETFYLEEDDNETFRLNSTVREIGGSGKAGSQELLLTSDFRPSRYLINGNVVYKGNSAEAAILEDHANYTVSSIEGLRTRRVELDHEPVVLDYSVMSHFVVIHQAILRQLAEETPIDQIVFTQLTPQALVAERLSLVSQEASSLNTESDLTLTADRYRLRSEGQNSLLIVDLYESGGELIAVHYPKQDGIPTTQGMFAYRSDLYPDLIIPSSR
jgi:hypothetical protein